MTAPNPESSAARVEAAGDSHHVLVVHGTFNAPEAGQRKWFQLDPNNPANFCHRLNELLRHTSLGAAVERSAVAVFSWSGENDHFHRIKAARDLCAKMVRLTEEDPAARIHLVAHSHGGNVALKAVEFYHEHLRAQVRDLVGALRKGAELGEEEAVRRALEGTLPSQREKLPRRGVEMLQRHLRAIRTDAPPARAWQTLRMFFWSDAMKQFARAWMTAPETNRLGRMVFMGTPFYRKQWIVSSSGAVRFLKYLLSNLHVAPFYAGGLYLMVLLYAGFMAWLPWFTFIGANPLGWPAWVLVLWLVVSGFAIVVGYTEQPYFNTNVYFNERGHRNRLNVRMPIWSEEQDAGSRRPSPPEPVPARRIPALVFTARYLDEALLGLSSEAVVYADLVPRIRQLLSPPLGFRTPSWMKAGTGTPRRDAAAGLEAEEWRVGVDPASTASFYQAAANWFITTPLRCLYVLVWPLWALTRAVVVRPLLTKSILSVVCGAAYGLPPNELRGARIQISHRLNLPEVFDETEVDLSADLLCERQPAARNEEPPRRDADVPPLAERYAHLCDDAALAARRRERESSSEASHWHLLLEAVPTLFRRYRAAQVLEPKGLQDTSAATRQDFENELARVWLTMEQRVREMSGAIELNHSLYYSNRAVIERIAEFLGEQRG